MLRERYMERYMRRRKVDDNIYEFISTASKKLLDSDCKKLSKVISDVKVVVYKVNTKGKNIIRIDLIPK